jgi:SAM-dependent methyltransferase
MNKIQEYWNEQAQKYKDSPLATTPDLISCELETREILKYLKDGQNVLDIGCGNGYKDETFCWEKNITVKGIDYSEEMIKMAKEYEFARLEFEHGDILNLKESGYDIVITDRCLINLESIDDQITAIDNIHNALKPDGTYLMLECTKEGLGNINAVREQFGLPLIEERWHNNYLGREIIKYIYCKFGHCEEVNFNSTYFLISRTLNALVTPEGQAIDYNSDINKYAAQLPPLGDYAPLKLFALRK